MDTRYFHIYRTAPKRDLSGEAKEEMLDVCDENGFPTGETVSRRIAHRDGILHRTVQVWVAREKDNRFEILLQKRSMQKDSFPGVFDTSSAGHISAGEEPLSSAVRELGEELGISADESELKFAGLFRIRYEQEFHGELFRDNEVTRVFVYQEPVDIRTLTLQSSEVSEVRWFDLEEVYTDIRISRDRFCVSREGLDVIKAFLTEENR